MQNNPYASHFPQQQVPQRPAQQPQNELMGPAIGMIVTSGIQILISGIWVLMLLLGLMGLAASNTSAGGHMFYMVVLLINVLVFAISALVLFGGIRMLQREQYAMVRNAAVCACIPCLSPLGILCIPFGIWGLVVLKKNYIVNMFKS